MTIVVIGLVIFGFRQSRRSQMARSAKERRSQAAWDRIEALGGHGVWEPEMCAVSLARTAVTDEDLSLFRDFPYVQILDLSHTGIGDAGLAHLSGLEALEGLTVIDTKIREAALDAFRRARPSVRITTEPPPKGALNPFTGKPWREGGARP
jgi:hypothetical protein